MKIHKKIVYAACTLSLLAVPALTACSSNNTASTSKDSTNVQESKKQADKKTLQSHIQAMQATLKSLQGALEKNDEKQVQQYGKKLNDQWLSYENEIREKYPLLYTDAEKYLQPLYTEVTMEQLDLKKVQELSVSLERSLSNLAHTKETAIKTSEALQKAVEVYKEYVNEQTAQLVIATKSFTDAVKAKDIEKAKTLYAEARVYYERIEPVAESFGDLDPKIDARENDVDPSEWSGFHRIEKALWKDASLEGMDKYADQLNQDVAELQKKMQVVKLDPTQVVAGSIELLNEAAISKITGEEERYSHIDIMDFASNVEGSQAVYHAILPALNEKNPQLAQQLDTEFNKLTALLGQYKQNHSYVNYTELTKDQIRELSQQLSVLSESIAQTAEIFG